MRFARIVALISFLTVSLTGCYLPAELAARVDDALTGSQGNVSDQGLDAGSQLPEQPAPLPPANDFLSRIERLPAYDSWYESGRARAVGANSSYESRMSSMGEVCLVFVYDTYEVAYSKQMNMAFINFDFQSWAIEDKVTKEGVVLLATSSTSSCFNDALTAMGFD